MSYKDKTIGLLNDLLSIYADCGAMLAEEKEEWESIMADYRAELARDNVDFVMMVGIAGSGKSTLCRNLMRSYKEEGWRAAIVSSDAIRGELYGDEGCQKNPEEVFRIMNERTIALLNAGISVIYDATNLEKARRVTMLNKVRAEVPRELYCGCIYVPCLVETAIERQKNRSRKVPDEVIRKQFDKLEIPDEDEGWDFVNGDFSNFSKSIENEEAINCDTDSRDNFPDCHNCEHKGERK